MKCHDGLFYRTTRSTNDADAIRLNDSLNDVLAKIEIGQQLADLFRERFFGNASAFRRWVSSNLDCSPKSAGRYMNLFNYSDLLVKLGPIDLVKAYKLTSCEGENDVNSRHAVWKLA
jgi:hypothetical protein